MREYTRAPVSNVALIESDLPWAELAAIPETYATAWTCLFRNLEIEAGPNDGDSRRDIVVRAGRGESRGQCGREGDRDDAQSRALRDARSDRRIARRSRRTRIFRSALRKRSRSMPCSISSATARSSIRSRCCVAVAARVSRDGSAVLRRSRISIRCLQMSSGVYLTFFGSFVFGTPGFPLSDVPLQAIAADIAAGRLNAKPSRVFAFDEIREAHRVMEANEAERKDGRRSLKRER